MDCDCCSGRPWRPPLDPIQAATFRYDLNAKILTREDKTKPFEPIFLCAPHAEVFKRFAGTLTLLKGTPP